MNFSAVNRGNPDQSVQNAKLPPHITRCDSVSDSADSTDPPAGPRPTSHTQSPFKQYTGSLKKSPTGLNAYREVSDEEDGFDAPVMSDLTRRGRPSALSKLVNVSRPSEPDETKNGGSSNATSTTPARGRGRPKGSVNKLRGLPGTAAAGRQARQVKPRPYPEGFVGFPKRRGRPPKPPSPPPRELYYRTNVQFFPFLCEWMDCKAELHNLETLRRHVYKVHGGSVECLWGNCGRLEEPPEFENDEGFDEHVEEAHLIPLSWHVGDGPNNLAERGLKKNKEDDDIPDYLKDEHGNQVTPSIRDQVEEDLLTWRKNRRKLKELLIRMNDNLPDEVDEEGDIKQQDA
ncbi:hypothetical protein FSPOR_10101 [Fusarium sporotrichioides]|uniref:C2H2-type domain-containing protein n=1 Tax=Fusarium sporotrichioides TaxID=5514 RepID=A0A395RN23_FUSSP|nr:hypothetical protein FSPOR_10101 [Fusarium sporotrichioides]